MSTHSDPTGALILGTFAGLWTFFKGFRVFREYKVVVDTPRTNIRSISMGLVHIGGSAQVDSPVPSPVSRTPCCFYKVEIDHWKSEGKSRGWAHLRTDVGGSKFFVADQTGKVLVDAHSAEFDVPLSCEREVDSAHPRSAAPSASDTELLEFVTYSGVHRVAGVMEHFLEKKGPLDDPRQEATRQSLLGIAQAVPNLLQGGGVPIELVEKMAAQFPVKDAAQEEKRQEVLRRFQQMAKGGMVDLPMHQGSAASGRYRLKEYLVVPGQQYTITATCLENPGATAAGDHNLITKGSHEATFLISSKSDRGTQGDLRRRALAMVLGGAALALACLAFLLLHLNLF